MNKKRMKILIISLVVLLIVLVGGTFAFLYFMTDIFKSPDQLFYKYLAQNTEIVKLVEQPGLEAFNSKKQLNSYINVGDFSFEITSNDAELKEVADIMNDLTVNFSGRADRVNDRAYQEINLLYKTTNLFKLKYLQDGNKYALASDDIVNKYVGIENNNLKELAKKFGLTDEQLVAFPDKIEVKDYSSLFEISDADAKRIQETYSAVFTNNIPKEKFVKEDKMVIQQNNQSYDINRYSLSLTDKEINNVLTQLLTTLKNDDATLNLIIAKMALIDETQQLTVDELKESIQAMLDENQEVEENGSTLKITVFEYNGSLMKTTVEIDAEEWLVIEKKENEYHLTMSATKDDQNTKIVMILGKQDNTTNIGYSIYINEEEQMALNLKITTQTQESGSKTNIEIIGKIDQTQVKAVMNNKEEFTNAIDSIDELNNGNSIMINDYPADQIAALIVAIQEQFQKVLVEKMQVILVNQ